MPHATADSGVSSQTSYWNPKHVPVQIAICSSDHDRSRFAVRTTTKKLNNCSFPPLKRSAAEMRCDDMIRAHHAEVRRNSNTEGSLRRQVEDHERATKRLRSEREQLQVTNKRLVEQLADAKRAPPPEAVQSTARKRLLDLIRRVHPDKVSATLDRTKLTQGLTEVLELL